MSTPTQAEAASASLVVSPQDALIDVPRSMVVHGLLPGERVTVQSRTVRGPGVPWQSGASFVADAAGTVDLARDPAQAGSYQGVSPMGLIWSQAPDVAGSPREVFAAEPSAALTTDISVQRTNGAPLHARLVQRLSGAGVTRHELREDGLAGSFFLPAGEGPHPAVIVLNGSGGGITEPRAALYASHGYAALALGYFKAPGLSDYISNTPLEYFETALAWVGRVLRPRESFIALSGQSRGGELVLLLGSLFAESVSAVIGYVPGAVVHSAQNACDPATGRDGPAWIYRGKPLPHLWENNRTASWDAWDNGPQPRRHTDALLSALRDPAAVARAAIAVEKIRGPVILLSATDDGSWPSSLYSRMVHERLTHARHPHAVQHLEFAGAGHSIVFPYVPTTRLIYAHPVSGRLSTTGGHPLANARADEASWHGVLQFLQNAVRRHSDALLWR